MTDAERESQTRLLGIRARDELCSIDAGSVGEQACKIDRRELLRLLDEALAAVQTQNGVVLAGTRKIVVLEAGIARLTDVCEAWANQGRLLQQDKDTLHTKIAEWELEVDKLRTEIARLHGYTSGHDKPCLICKQPCNGIAGNPSLWPVRLGNNGWHHIGCLRDALAELDRLRTPPEADVIERVKLILHSSYCPNIIPGNASCDYPDCRESLCEFWKTGDAFACAIRDYGDQCAREAEQKLSGERQHHAGQMLAIEDAKFHERNRILAILRKWDENPAEWDSETEDRDFRQIRYVIERRAREATETERSRCAQIDGIDLAAVQGFARATALEEAAKIYRYIIAQCGTPDPVEACRLIIATCNRALANTPPSQSGWRDIEEMKVNVSKDFLVWNGNRYRIANWMTFYYPTPSLDAKCWPLPAPPQSGEVK